MTRTLDSAHQGRIVQIEVDNFKSYRGRQIIGPFYDFTAVVGANGSGKSNLMDAISFVLGVKTAQLRGSLKELLYLNSEGRDEEDGPRRGYVKLVFETTDGEEVHFTRAIVPSNSTAEASYQSQYKINDRNSNWEAYNNKLKSYGILVQARNFLVFQVFSSSTFMDECLIDVTMCGRAQAHGRNECLSCVLVLLYAMSKCIPCM